MIGPVLLGAGFGLGLLAIGRGIAPPTPPLAEVLAALDRQPPQPSETSPVHDGGWTARLGQPFTGVLAGLGLPTRAIRRDLAATSRPIERHLAEKAATALTGLVLPPAIAFLMALGGAGWPWPIPAWVSLALGAAGFIAPDLAVRADAAKRRAEFRHALSTYLDLVAIALAGGSGVQAALHHAAAAGSGWAFDHIRAALHAAQLLRRPPWQHLGDLGTRLGIPELVELSGSVALAGTEGAKVRASLTARAASMRARQLTDAESRAQAATEQLSLPLVLLFAAFLLLIGFPAITQVLTGF